MALWGPFGPLYLSLEVPLGIKGKLPEHVAIIMDGNGRWAQRRGLARVEGHRAGVERVDEIVEAASRIGIKYLSLFAFSTENWNRPKEEVDFLMELFALYLDAKREKLLSGNVRLNVMGRVWELPEKVQKKVAEVEEATRSCTGLVLNLAVNYGGRGEIVDAAKRIAEAVLAGRIGPDRLTEELFSSYLYDTWIPDVDLLIRTGGELRISNFLLWRLAYAELYFTPVLWPDFTEDEFRRAIEDFTRRERRFGAL